MYDLHRFITFIYDYTKFGINTKGFCINNHNLHSIVSDSYATYYRTALQRHGFYITSIVNNKGVLINAIFINTSRVRYIRLDKIKNESCMTDILKCIISSYTCVQ